MEPTFQLDFREDGTVFQSCFICSGLQDRFDNSNYSIGQALSRTREVWSKARRLSGVNVLIFYDKFTKIGRTVAIF